MWLEIGALMLTIFLGRLQEKYGTEYMQLMLFVSNLDLYRLTVFITGIMQNSFIFPMATALAIYVI